MHSHANVGTDHKSRYFSYQEYPCCHMLQKGCSTHWQVRILKGIDNFLEEAAKGGAPPPPFPELNVCILPRHPAGLGPQVAKGAVKAGHHVVQQQPLQLILVRGLAGAGTRGTR